MLGDNLPSQESRMFADYDSAIGGGGFGGLLVGTPTTVGTQLARTVANSGANYLMCSCHWGALTHAEALHSLQLFAGEVMPKLRDAASRAGV
jgi:alkanesulfonate monooxygenase SsuD/methylene tetrahydromethanopterin reductase-like flavin-dependent oxidoreductase (luciferase family)